MVRKSTSYHERRREKQVLGTFQTLVGEEGRRPEFNVPVRPRVWRDSDGTQGRQRQYLRRSSNRRTQAHFREGTKRKDNAEARAKVGDSGLAGTMTREI
jgi:hypothetical protein